MITGTVNARLEIIVKYTIQDAFGNWHAFEAIVDTGFSGSLSLPPPVIAVLGLPFDMHTVVVLADGSTCNSADHVANIVWDGLPRQVRVAAMAGVPLLGTHLLSGFDLRARFRMDGVVEIEAIP